MDIKFYETNTFRNLLEVYNANYIPANNGDFIEINSIFYRVKSKCYRPQKNILEIELKESK